MSSQKRSRANFESDGPPSHAPYAYYGTALPAFDPSVRDDGSYVPEWKQEVTDERGRKRLHGAFTGGWSAGYVMEDCKMCLADVSQLLQYGRIKRRMDTSDIRLVTYQSCQGRSAAQGRGLHGR